MDIILGVTNDEKNKLNKTITDDITLSGYLREQTSVINPSVMIEVDYSNIDMPNYNYMYIPFFNRYYFISDMIVIRSGLWRVNGIVDVLMSFKEGIETCPIIISETETTEYENYMSGYSWKTTVKSKTDIISFSGGLNNNGEYILITSGG